MCSGCLSRDLDDTPTRLPQEIIETIIVHLTHDTRSLRTCTLTCHFWCIDAAPHLYHTLFTSIDPWDQKGGGRKAVQPPYPTALTSVRELVIDSLDIPSFMPRIRQYFGHFNGPLSRPEGFPRFPFADCTLHRAVLVPGRPRTPL